MARRGTEVDPRIERTREVVLATALELLSERGSAGVNIESVAARSGVAKSTIYRHWPDRSALLIDAFASLHTEELPLPEGVSVREDLRRVLTGLVDRLNGSSWAPVLPSLIEASARDEGLRESLDKLVAGQRDPLRRAIEGGQQRGEVDPDADVSVLMSQLAGPLFYRRMITHEPIDHDIAVAIVDRVLDAVVIRRRRARAKR